MELQIIHHFGELTMIGLLKMVFKCGHLDCSLNQNEIFIIMLND